MHRVCLFTAVCPVPRPEAAHSRCSGNICLMSAWEKARRIWKRWDYSSFPAAVHTSLFPPGPSAPTHTRKHPQNPVRFQPAAPPLCPAQLGISIWLVPLPLLSLGNCVSVSCVPDANGKRKTIFLPSMKGWSTLNKRYKGGCFMTKPRVLLGVFVQWGQGA